jgi:hypothetical protein
MRNETQTCNLAAAVAPHARRPAVPPNDHSIPNNTPDTLILNPKTLLPDPATAHLEQVLDVLLVHTCARWVTHVGAIRLALQVGGGREDGDVGRGDEASVMMREVGGGERGVTWGAGGHARAWLTTRCHACLKWKGGRMRNGN